MLALQPKILLLDEPTAGLDPGARRELLAHLVRLQQPSIHPSSSPEAEAEPTAEGMTIVLSSHQMEDIAALCRSVTVMSGGTTVLSESVDEVFANGERLRGWRLDQPVASQIAEELSLHGWALPHSITSEAQLIEAVAACVQN
jgi:energy-coupling factor transport system ATP-binding protein